MIKLLKFEKNSDNTQPEIHKNNSSKNFSGSFEKNCNKNQKNNSSKNSGDLKDCIDGKDECLFDTILIDYIKFTKEKFLLDYVRLIFLNLKFFEFFSFKIIKIEKFAV